MMHRRIDPVTAAVVATLVVGGLALVRFAGSMPWLDETAGYGVLATIVALNTLGFGLVAAVKMGYYSGRSALRVGPPVTPPS
jgi:hypothetical protein